MKTTVRIPTGMIAQVLTEALAMDEPVTSDEPIEIEFEMKAKEFPRYVVAVTQLAEKFDELMNPSTDGTSPYTFDEEEEAA